MTVEIVTYANKSFGMFEKLVNNDFSVKVKVLGMGKKWNGYIDKSIGLLEYMETKKDDDIIVFVDGFDTKINKNPYNIRTLFESYDCKVLVSSDFGVAQKRQRLIFIAIRNDISEKRKITPSGIFQEIENIYTQNKR